MNANQNRYKGKFCKSNVVRWKNKVIKSNKTRHNLPKPIGKYQYSANLMHLKWNSVYDICI